MGSVSLRLRFNPGIATCFSLLFFPPPKDGCADLRTHLFWNMNLRMNISCLTYSRRFIALQFVSQNKCDGFIWLSLSFSASMSPQKPLKYEFISLHFQISVALKCNCNPFCLLFVFTEISKERVNSNFNGLTGNIYKSLAIVTPI